MIITRTPLRMSFAGGGTDLASFYRQTPGAVVSMAINKYFYLAMHDYFFEKGYLLKYSKTETVDDVKDIEHSIIRTVFSDFGIDKVDFSSAADVPSGSGMGSSSAFTVSLLHLVHAYLGKHCSQRQLAHQACDVEIEKLGNPIGKQDQYGCAIGGLKFIEFLPDEQVVVEPIFLRPDERVKLEDNLFLFFLGNQRSASAILDEQNERTKSDRNVHDALCLMADQARRLKSEITQSVDAVGEYLREGWELKKTLTNSISNSLVDEAHRKATEAGATGAKLLGAGAGGFLLTYAPRNKHAALVSAMKDYPLHKVRIDPVGSTVIFDDRDIAS